MDIIKKLLSIMWKENKAIFLIGIIFTLFSAFLTMMQAEIGQALFSAINENQKLEKTIVSERLQDEYSGNNPFLILYHNLNKIHSLKDFLYFVIEKKSIGLIIFTSILFLLFYFLLKVFMYLQGYLQSFLAFKGSVQMQRVMFEKLLKIPSLYFRTKLKAGDLISRIISDINSIRVALLNIFNTLFFIPILVIFSIIMLYIKNHLFTTILIVGGLLGILLINIVAKLVKTQVVQSSKKLASTASYINQTIYGIDAIKVFNAEENEKKQFNSLLSNYVGAYKKLIKLSLLERPITELLGVLIFLFILISGSFLFWKGKLSLDQIIGFLLYLVVLAPNIQNVSKILFQINNAQGANQRLDEILKMENESQFFGKKELKSFSGNIEFLKLFFSYNPDNSKNFEKNDFNIKQNINEIHSENKEELNEKEHALYDISLKINSGEFIAIVGPSGAGKSTFISLIPGLIYPTYGKIYFDGEDYQQYTLESIRRYIAIVPQEVVLFPDTIYNNILFGNLSAKEDDVYYYSKLANIDDFIRNLPDGYNTILGERGMTVSGGQKQRIAIARALIKQPKVLIFDEATSSLDSESEKSIQSAMEKIKHLQTTIVIAHRLSTVLKADRIVVLNKGRIVEIGRHDELLEKNGLYTNLYNSQFKS